MNIKTLLASTSLLFAANSFSEVISVEITNLTHGTYFTPILVSSHPYGNHFFELGQSSSPALQAMAEGGDISGLVTQANTMGAISAEDPAGGPLAPGQSTSVASMDTGSNTQLSIMAMILPTNDGFVGLDSWTIPSEPGQYTIMLDAYDAGTEANDEVVNGAGAPGALGIPANPGGNGGTGGTGVTTAETTTTVHVHRGVIGDTNATGGASDLDSRIHRWLNPVAKVVVTVE